MTRPRVRPVLLATLLGLALLYSGALGCLYSVQRKLVFPAPPPRPARARGATVLELSGAQGPVYAWHLPGPPGAPVVVHFHGNAEQLADQDYLLEACRGAGLGFLAVELPGYGPAAAQTPSEAGAYAAAEAALAHLATALGVGPERVVLSGRSLGTGVAAEMALRGRAARLALISPYTSIPDVASEVVPLAPTHLLVRDRFETAAKAPKVTVPVLIIHGTADEVVPFRMGEALAKAFPHAELRAVAGADHVSVVDRPGVLEAYLAFARGPATGSR